MPYTHIGLLHPGMMGSTIGGAARNADATVYWASEGRSADSRNRAEMFQLEECETVADLLERSEIVLSVCPPHGAVALAERVIATGYRGTYVDANAIAPANARKIAALCKEAGVEFVDGGIIGPPAHNEGTTRMYLSGMHAPNVAALFEHSPLAAIPIDGGAGAASALKMCFAANSKGYSALLIAIRALAQAEGIEGALLEEWGHSMPQTISRSEAAAMGTAPKAWRFVGEMEEIAATFAGAGLSDGFHNAAADLYSRMGEFKGREDAVELAEVLHAILKD